MEKRYFIAKTGDTLAIDKLIKYGKFDDWIQRPNIEMSYGDVVFIYDKKLTPKAKGAKWLPFKCAAELVGVAEQRSMDFRLLYKISYKMLDFTADEKEVIANMGQGVHGVYELKDEKIISKLAKQNSPNIIKEICDELKMTYKELGEAIGYGEGAIKNSASTGNISEPMAHAIKMYRQILELEREVADSEAIKESLKKWLK